MYSLYTIRRKAALWSSGVSDPDPLDFLLGDLLVAVVVDPRRVGGGVPRDVLGDL